MQQLAENFFALRNACDVKSRLNITRYMYFPIDTVFCSFCRTIHFGNISPNGSRLLKWALAGWSIPHAKIAKPNLVTLSDRHRTPTFHSLSLFPGCKVDVWFSLIIIIFCYSGAIFVSTIYEHFTNQIYFSTKNQTPIQLSPPCAYRTFRDVILVFDICSSP